MQEAGPKCVIGNQDRLANWQLKGAVLRFSGRAAEWIEVRRRSSAWAAVAVWPGGSWRRRGSLVIRHDGPIAHPLPSGPIPRSIGGISGVGLVISASQFPGRWAMQVLPKHRVFV